MYKNNQTLRRWFAASCIAAQAQTLTVVAHAALRTLDPALTTAHIVRNHGYMVYDTLLATDAKGAIQPQMVQGWEVGDGGHSYTFTLREGLKWHDGSPVTAQDCVASIQRWASQDKMGQLMTADMETLQALDTKRLQIKMKYPGDLPLRALAKPSGVPAFMMPERIAKTPASQAITDPIGSGPFKMVMAEYRPGVQVVYEKNKDYVPRSEPPSALAGGKQVKLDKVRQIVMPDAMTAINALTNGEVDMIEQVSVDLEPMLAKNKNITVQILDPQGYQTIMRMNHLHPPFNNKKIRQAAMYAIGQEDILQAAVGNPKYYKTCAAIFGCGTPYESQDGADMIIKAQPEKAAALLKEAGYDGTPVVLLQPTDLVQIKSQPIVIAQALRKAGFKVDMQAMDWQTVVSRRAVQAPLKDGGWSIFATNNLIAEVSDPLRAYAVVANGKDAWFGWPDVPEIEESRVMFARAPDEEIRKKIARDIQQIAIDEGVLLPMGQMSYLSAWRNNVNGLLQGPVPVFWGVGKK